MSHDVHLRRGPMGRESLGATLDALVHLVEQQSDEMLASVLLLGPDGRLHHGAAPSLPAAYNQAVDGLAIGEGIGSCGTAAFRGERVIVADVRTDPLWRDFRGLAADHGLRACWSTPILGTDGSVLGTFALYYRDPRKPTSQEIELTEWAVRLAAAAIERERSAAALRHSEARLREIFEQAPAIIAILRGPEHVFESANRLYNQAVGWREILGRSVADALPELVEQGFVELLDRVYRTGQAFAANEVPILVARGRDSVPDRIYLNFVYQPLLEADGSVSGVLLHAVDVTDQVHARRRLEQQTAELEAANAELEQANAALRASEEQFRTLAESIPQLAWMAHADGGVFWFNQRWYEYTGTTPEEVEGWGWQSVHDPDVLPAVLRSWRRSLESGQPFEMEFPLRGADGTFRWFLTRVMPVKEPGGRVLRWFGTNTNVDEQRRAVEERDRALREAEAARRAAEVANGAKSAFLATMSHELRTPINAVIGYTELLAMGISGPMNEAQRAQLERVRASSQHLLSLISDILDLAKVEAGQVPVTREQVRVREVVRQAVAIVETQAARKRIDLRDETHHDPAATGDPDRVRQILTNLLGNAVKFTDAGGRIRIDCRVVDATDSAPGSPGRGPWVRVDVEDDGIGIPPEELEGIFEPFRQVDSRLTRKQEGTGLGLTISRNLARLMGGDLTVASRPGEGSCFTLWLRPRAAAPAGSGEDADEPSRPLEDRPLP